MLKNITDCPKLSDVYENGFAVVMLDEKQTYWYHPLSLYYRTQIKSMTQQGHDFMEIATTPN